MRDVADRVALAAIFLAAVVVLARYVAPATFPLADYHTYAAASRSLYARGNPYLANQGAGLEFQYRYPPLLALAMPAVRWIWFPLVALGISVPPIIRFRSRGVDGLLLPAQISPTWIMNLLNGNAQALTIGMTAMAPTWVRAGAVLVAVATWLKLYPVCVGVWWLGRRNWTALRWFMIAFIGLGLIQAPWLPEFIDYSRSQLSVPAQSSLRALGPVPWIGVVLVLSYLTYSTASRERIRGGDRSWLYCILLQLAVLPRLQVANLPLLLIHPTLFSAPYSALTDRLGRRSVLMVMLGGATVGLSVLMVSTHRLA